MKSKSGKKDFMTGILLPICLLLFIGCSSDQKQPEGSTNNVAKGTLAKLQGKWQSDDDGSSMIEIKDDKFISYYNKQEMSTETIEIINDAEERKADPNGKYFIVKGEFDAMIYYLVAVSKDKLEYSFTGRGNTLKYTKVK